MKKQKDIETVSIDSDDIEIEMMKLDLKFSDKIQQASNQMRDKSNDFKVDFFIKSLLHIFS